MVYTLPVYNDFQLKSLEERAARIFLDAAGYIRQYGWQVSGMAKYGQPRCSMGALASAYRNKRWDRKLSSLMYSVLGKELKGEKLTHFNERVRDGEEVALLFERSANSLMKDTESLR